MPKTKETFQYRRVITTDGPLRFRDEAIEVVLLHLEKYWSDSERKVMKKHENRIEYIREMLYLLPPDDPLIVDTIESLGSLCVFNKSVGVLYAVEPFNYDIRDMKLHFVPAFDTVTNMILFDNYLVDNNLTYTAECYNTWRIASTLKCPIPITASWMSFVAKHFIVRR